MWCLDPTYMGFIQSLIERIVGSLIVVIGSRCESMDTGDADIGVVVRTEGICYEDVAEKTYEDGDDDED